MLDMDAADKAFLDSFLPEGAIPIGYAGVVAFMDADGVQRWRLMVNFEAPVSHAIGLLEMAKLRLLGDCPGSNMPWEDDQ